MSHKENISPLNDKISENKENIPINIYKSNTPEKPKNSINLINKSKYNPTSLEDKLSKGNFNDNKFLINSNIRYGIDESGNPINIKEYYKSINDSVNLNSNTSIFSGLTNIAQKLKKPIAYITKDENNNNILIDLKGNKITTKNKDGDYDFPLELHVVIKDFDVKHPELRVNGERFYKDDDILEDINITEEVEKEKENENEKDNISKINKNEENNIKINNTKEHFEGFGEIYSRNNNKNELGNLVFRSYLSKNNKDSIYYTKYNNINLFETNNNINNKVVFRTNGILNSSNNSHSQSPDYFKNKPKANNFINLINNNYKEMTKNRSFIGNIIGNNTSNFLSFRYKRDLSDSHKKGNIINNRIKSFKSALNINNNINSIFKRRKFDKGNDIKFFHRNKNRSNIFNEKSNTDINISSQQLNYIYSKDNKNGKNNNQKILNKNIDNYRYKENSHIENNKNNLYFAKSQNYFIMNHNKSFTNSKLLNKKDNNNNEGKEKILKKCNKKSLLIPTNRNKIQIKNNKYMIDFHKFKNKSNNSNIKKIKKENNKINSQDISQRIKKIEENKKSKIFQINNNDINKKYNILSEEANNIIKSYSKNKLKKDNEISKKIEIMVLARKQKSPNNRLNKYNLLSNENNPYFNNSFFSSTVNKKYYNYKFKYENKYYLSKNDFNKINTKYTGITLSLPKNENNKDKNDDKSGNNKITNINFAPFQSKCESLVKNDINNQDKINNNIEKNRFNEFDKKNEMNFIFPNHKINL